MKYLFKAIIAGIFIGTGAWAYLSINNTILGALLFSCGLLGIRMYNLHLYTGKTQYICTKNYNLYDYLVILFGNLLGILIISFIAKPALTQSSILLGLIKYEQPFHLALVKGIGCGILMSIATYKKAPLYISSLCVMTFILASFNHCIADAFYLFVANRSLFCWGWFGTLVGNTLGGLIGSYYLTSK